MEASWAIRLVTEAKRLTRSWSWWRVFVLGLLVANIKSLPLIWHFRIIRGIISHFLYRPARFTPSIGSRALFQPIITSSRCPLYECDYNIHKSNSTYFTDLDISRLHLMTCLIKGGVDKMAKERRGTNQGRFGIILGGVGCSFKREIQPYQAYEIWSRVLCWDRKWIYVVSHFVEKGSARPSGYTLQPWKNPTVGRSRGHKDSEREGNGGTRTGRAETRSKSMIFATGTAKYVIKEGRVTVPPERFFEACGLLPARPSNAPSPSQTSSPSVETSTVDLGAASTLSDLTPAAAESILDSSLGPGARDEEPWTWDRIEEERKKGVRILEAMEGLDALHDTFTGDECPALGKYTDLL